MDSITSLVGMGFEELSHVGMVKAMLELPDWFMYVLQGLEMKWSRYVPEPLVA